VRVGRSWSPGVALHALRSCLSWSFFFVREAFGNAMVVFVTLLFRCVSFARLRLSFSRVFGFEQYCDKVLRACWPILGSRGRHAFTKIDPFSFSFVGHLTIPFSRCSYFLQLCSGAFLCATVQMYGCMLVANCQPGPLLTVLITLFSVKLSSMCFFQCAHPSEGHIARTLAIMEPKHYYR